MASNSQETHTNHHMACRGTRQEFQVIEGVINVWLQIAFRYHLVPKVMPIPYRKN